MMDTIYIVTLYEYEEDMGRFYFSSKEKAEKFAADMSVGTDGDFYISEGSVDVPYEVPESVWFHVDENGRVTVAYWTDTELIEIYDEDDGTCLVNIKNTRNRAKMEKLAVARAKEILLERAR